MVKRRTFATAMISLISTTAALTADVYFTEPLRLAKYVHEVAAAVDILGIPYVAFDRNRTEAARQSFLWSKLDNGNWTPETLMIKTPTAEFTDVFGLRAAVSPTAGVTTASVLTIDDGSFMPVRVAGETAYAATYYDTAGLLLADSRVAVLPTVIGAASTAIVTGNLDPLLTIYNSIAPGDQSFETALTRAMPGSMGGEQPMADYNSGKNAKGFNYVLSEIAGAQKQAQLLVTALDMVTGVSSALTPIKLDNFFIKNPVTRIRVAANDQGAFGVLMQVEPNGIPQWYLIGIDLYGSVTGPLLVSKLSTPEAALDVAPITGDIGVLSIIDQKNNMQQAMLSNYFARTGKLGPPEAVSDRRAILVNPIIVYDKIGTGGVLSVQAGLPSDTSTSTSEILGAVTYLGKTPTLRNISGDVRNAHAQRAACSNNVGLVAFLTSQKEGAWATTAAW